MGSFKRDGQGQGPNRRRSKSSPKRQGFLGIESLESRRLLTGGGQTLPAPYFIPTSSDISNVQNGPMANMGEYLIGVYESYLSHQGQTSQLPGEYPLLQFQGDSVLIAVNSLGGDFSQFQTSLQNLGLKVVSSSSYYGEVDGWLPVSQLPTVAEMAQTMSGHPVYTPLAGSEYQGIAYNEAETSLFADTARTQYGVDGTGVTLGVLSDSVSQYNGGLATSYGTGDLSATNPVTVIQDGPAGSTDEGRAMLENVHDIAPGANLQFATAFISELSFAQNIQALATAGSKIIADDVKYADEPMFQNGQVAQAINTVTAAGTTYFSMAFNDGPDSGYLSTFRGASGTVGGTTGTWMNFDPNGGTSLTLPITTSIANTTISFEFDQPYKTQEPAGSTATVSSVMYFYVLDSSGNVVTSGTTNTVAAQAPFQIVQIPNAGTYTVAVQLVSGPAPGHIEFSGFNDTNQALAVSQTYGSAGGTYYPTVWGHNATASAITVGATPWWAPAPYIAQNPLLNEPYSGSGPNIIVFNPDGTALSSPQTTLAPTLTAPDGGNTSFFDPGTTLNTAAPPIPGQPASSTNLVPANQQSLPVFFGTSSATPNAAAVAALMLQRVPSLTPAEIKAGMITSAEAKPMNGTTSGTWDPQGGYGLLNAIGAINAVDLLRVQSTNPANGATVTTAPSVIQVTFNKPVVFSSLSAADLTFTSTPPGVSVVVGAPIAIDNPTDPTVVSFPITLVRQNGVLADGSYTFSVQSPSNGNPVVSEDGKDLVGSGPIKFTLADVTAPDIVNTTVSGRTVTIKFSKALDPSTVNLSTIFVVRKDGSAAWPPTPSDVSSYIDLNNDPRTQISYNPLTFTVTLDYSNLPQSELPSDQYAIVALTQTASTAGVTDLVGNALDGYYTGSFPTTAYQGGPYDFIQNLGYEAVQAPTITTFTMTAATDTGIPNDQNTNTTVPQFIGQVYVPFPGSVSGDQVYVQFQGLQNNYVTNLGVGGGGRGYTGNFDVQATTTSTGTFTVTTPASLPEGFQDAVAVVVGQADQPPLPGYSSAYTDGFRIDTTPPQITAASFTQGGTALPLPNPIPPATVAPPPTNISTLSSLWLTVQDSVTPTVAPLGTPNTFLFPAIDPATASNISNYSLINVTTHTDESQYISSATLVPEAATAVNGYVTAYNAQINVTFTPGMPFGTYSFIAHTHELQYPGLADAAGNYLDDTSVAGEGTKDFIINFAIQKTPVYITSMALESSYSSDGSTVLGGTQSYFEVPPSSGTNTRDNVAAPPTAAVIDLSNPIPYGNYTPDVLLVRSANSASSAADGDFGTLGQGGLGASGTGFTIVPGTAVTLYNYNITTGVSTAVTAGGSGNRLVLTLAAGTTLPADYYRIYIPNQVDSAGNDTRIFDIYGNQLDGEFLGNQTSQNSPDFPNVPPTVTIPEYEDLQSDGTYRVNDMSGDGVAGGAFMTGFAVVPYGNIVYARPDYVENPLIPNTLSNGSLANPYPVLAPEGDPATAPANPNHNPNGGLNDSSFFNQSNFNLKYDLSGDGKFEQSALYAASQLSYNGPVVVVALPGLPSRNPVTGLVTEASFVMEAPAGSGPADGGSASVPFDTTLVFNAGTTLKLQNASLFVQNQGSALQTLGTASNPVTFTSYNDAAAGGATNNNPDTTPFAGDWGGIVFRNYDDAITSQQQQFPVDGTLVGANGGAAISGAQDAMSLLNFANIRYAGGAVPKGSSTFYSGITLYNSRPMITNDNIADVGGTGGTEGAIGADFNSLREDDTARGPLVRSVTTTANSLNGIYLMSEANGFIEPTSAMTYPTNPTSLGGSTNYTLESPLPYLIITQLVVGQELLEGTGGNTEYVTNRLYVQPGTILKFNKGAGLDVLNPGASLNVGSRSYINGFDASSSYGPGSAGFATEGPNDPQVIFTSIYDDAATTPFVPALDAFSKPSTTTLGMSLWGSVGIITGGVTVINDATFEYGGGALNTQQFTIDSQSVLSFITGLAVETFPLPTNWDPTAGTHAYITNDNFYDNFDTAMQIEPDGLLAADPLHPLASGHPFFRGNVMQGNGIDGLGVVTNRYYYTNPLNNYDYIGPREEPDTITTIDYVNQTVSAVWDSTDLTYVVRGTVGLGSENFFANDQGLPVPDTTAFTTEPKPAISLTIQSALPGTVLADGSTIPSPGQSVIVKLLNDDTPNGAGSLTGVGSTGVGAIPHAGAGFLAGVDDGVDPPGSLLIDPGVATEIRILGIPGNQTTGQQRVPVIITSLRDGTVGTTVRGVKMFNILESAPVYQTVVNPNPATNGLTTPAAGDGGYIYLGGLSMTEYDPTNPFDGSLIDNADISYMTRIEVQGGGLLNTFNNISGKPGTPSLTTADWWDQLSGYLAPVNQLNSPFSLTIADSNLADFSDAGVFVHPDALGAITVDWTGANGGVASTPGAITRNSLAGEPVFLYMYNDTISNSAQGVHINSQTGNDTNGDSVYQAVINNVTFYNDPIGIQTIAPPHSSNPDNSYASVEVLAMNDIFDGSTNAAKTGIAVDLQGQNAFSQLQYNLFYNNDTNVVSTTNDGDFEGNQGATYGNPDFVGPVGAGLTANNQNFELEPNSPAIDAGRSEIGPLAGGNAIYTGTDLTLAGGQVLGTRTDPATLALNEVPGKSDLFGEFGGFVLNNFFNLYDSRQIVTLPGSGFFSYPDEWQPVLTSNPNGYSGAASNGATYNYQPISGVRDILGYIRVPDPNVPGTGYGSNPFIDIGAYQYVNLNPPQVTAVTATVNSTTSGTGTATIPFYTVGGQSGSNTTPLTIDVTFSGPIDPSTLTGSTVQLQELGVTPGSTAQTISLAGKLAYDSATDTLIINLGASGLSLVTDKYRLTLFGSGAPVIANTQGIALDGENLSNGDDPNSGTQLALPSGNGYPGGNFYDSFIINTTPSSITKNTLAMSPASDSNIVGDNITNSTQPTFTGSITEPNPTLVPLAGQSAIIDVGIYISGTTYFSASQLPANLSGYAQYIRPNAGTGLTDSNGNFSVTIGVDGANTGLVTNTTPLANLQGVYNVGPDGLLSPVPGDDNGFYVARARVIDQSGNQSNVNDPNAQLPFIVDTTPPTASFVSPTSGQVITSLTGNAIQFTITTSENIDMTHFTAASIKVVSAGPDGILGTSDDVTIPVDPSSISMKLLDAGTGGTGREQISFATSGTLTNDLYQVTLLNTGTEAVRDIAGNVLATAVSQQFAVAVPSLSTEFFVGAASYVTDPTATIGTRENPFPTISAAMTKASAGSVVAVLPGVYTELVTMKQFVRLLSVSASSTDSTVFTTSTGDPLSTVIRAPASNNLTGIPTINATNLQSFVGLETEIAGFTIASPLVGDPALGFIDPVGIAIGATNSNILIDKNYIADAGVGINVVTSGFDAQTPQIENNVIDGNIEGVQFVDAGTTTSVSSPADLINNDFVFNTIGVQLSVVPSTPMMAYAASNIFWQNHDQSNARYGYAIFSSYPNKISLQNNLFSGNGASDTSQVNATNNLGNGFNPANLSSTPDSLGNFVGNPAFVYPVDARPGSDGPADLFVDADFQLTALSAAIDNAWEATAIPTDILGNSQVKIAGDGYGLPGFGPRDVGAFEYNGTGGGTVGGSFRVTTTSLVPVGGALYADGATLTTSSAPTSIDVTFSGNIAKNSINATDLVLSGSAANSGVHATSLTWIDSHTVQFNLSGQLNLPGTLDVAVTPGSIESTTGQKNLGYSDHVVLQIGDPPVHVNPTPMPTPVSTPVTTPTPIISTPTPTPVGVSPSPSPSPSPVPVKKKHHVVVHTKPVAHPKPVKHGTVKKVTHHAAKPVVHHAAKPVVHHAAKPVASHGKVVKVAMPGQTTTHPEVVVLHKKPKA